MPLGTGYLPSPLPTKKGELLPPLLVSFKPLFCRGSSLLFPLPSPLSFASECMSVRKKTKEGLLSRFRSYKIDSLECLVETTAR